MLLSEDVFEGIAQLLGGSFAPAAAGQRRGPRVTLDTRLTILPCPEGPDHAEPALSVPVRDLSRGGLRFLHSERLPLDTPFVALLPRPRQLGTQPGADMALAVLAVVAYWQPLAKDLFALGGEFRRVLSGFELRETHQPAVVLPGLVGSERPASQTVEALRRAAG